MENKWNELIIKTEYDEFPKLESYLYENEIYSFEIIDPRIENIDNREGRWDFIEDDIFKSEFDGITVKIYSSSEDKDTLKNYKSEIDSLNLGITELNLIDDEDWKNNWKNFYKVQEIGENLVIVPEWEDYENKDNRITLNLNPKMAFGTGGHETTRMCLIAIEKYLKNGDDLFDLGCGSGILSIAAKKLGAAKVDGADYDEKAVEISKENAEIENVDIRFFHSDLFSSVDSKYQIIVANIVAEILVKVVDELDNYLCKDGIFICSGIIEEKSNLVINALEEKGYEILEKNSENEWVCIVARNS